MKTILFKLAIHLIDALVKYAFRHKKRELVFSYRQSKGLYIIGYHAATGEFVIKATAPTLKDARELVALLNRQSIPD